MTEPSKERIAAALALAEAVDDYEQAGPESWRMYVETRLSAYRATAPKLRTRGEVDAEIVAKIRDWADAGCGLMIGDQRMYELRHLCAEPVTDDAPEPLCTVHGNVEHGREAEELRSGIEELIREHDQVGAIQLQRLLDDVDARDSLVFSERAAELTEARARIADLEHDRRSIDLHSRGLIESLEEERRTNATLRADNERFARELLEARKPCERRHLTEAEEALCQFTEVRTPWEPSDFDGGGLEGICRIMNAVRDERRQQTKTKGDAEAAAMRSEEHRAPASAASPAEPEPERCSCEEALKLRLIVNIERQTSRELAQKIRDAIEVLS